MFKDDLASLEYINEDILIDNLKRHFNKNQIYTYIGDILLAINPYKELGLFSPREMFKYRNICKFDKPPHAFAMANHAYHAMVHERRNQRFVITGESGAGKTVTSNVLMKMLVYLGRAPYRNIEDKILQINPILEAFGNSPTPLNHNSSRFAKIVELSFSKVGKITGAKIYVFLLEHSRVMNLVENFHIFGYTMAGLQELGQLEQMLPKDHFQPYFIDYTGNNAKRDSEEFGKLKQAFSMIGMRSHEFKVINQIIFAIQLGKRVSFDRIDSSGNVEGSQEHDPDLLHCIAHLLGISYKGLRSSMLHSNLITKGDTVQKINTANQSQALMNALCKGIYARLFDYVVQAINRLLSYSLQVYGESNNIGILDIFGFENLNDNSLEQMCINTANEQMNYYFHQYIFCWEKEEHLLEDITVNVPTLPHNKAALELILARPIGIISLLDEESKFPSANDKTLSAKLNANLSTFHHFEPPRSSEENSFKIRHFAGTVTYSTDNFIEKNRNFLSPEMIALLRESDHEVIRFMFKTPFSKTGNLNHHHLQTQGAPATPSKQQDPIHSQTRSQQTIGNQFRYYEIRIQVSPPGP